MIRNPKIQAAKVDAAEKEAVNGIPKHIWDKMEKSQKKFEKNGGCKGCDSKVLGVHYGGCSANRSLFDIIY